MSAITRRRLRQHVRTRLQTPDHPHGAGDRGGVHNLEHWQLDCNTVFLNVDVMEEVYVKMAPGYEEFDDSGVPMVISFSRAFTASAKIQPIGGARLTSTWWGSASKASSRTKNLHLLGERDHRYFDPLCRRRPAALRTRRNA